MTTQTDTIPLTIVAAIGRRGELGREGQLLFRLKADMQHFRSVTRGRPVIMGRKTWDSLPLKPLPGRQNLVISRNSDLEAPLAHVYSSLGVASAAARAMAARSGAEGVCVIGGGQIYAAALPIADRIWLTEIDAETDADTFFPEFDRREWNVVSETRQEADADNEAPFVIRQLVRKSFDRTPS